MFSIDELHPSVVFFAVIGAACPACTLTRHEATPCETAQECRDAFGIDQVCGTEGFCQEIELPDRCSGLQEGTGPYPDDLFVNPAYQNAILLGGMMDFAQLDQRGRANAMKLAAFEANEESALEGRRFGYLFCDVQPDDLPTSTAPYDDSLVRGEAATQTADFFVNDAQLPVIVGPSASVDAIGIWQDVVHDTATMLFSPVATSLLITNLEAGPFSNDSPGMLWRIPAPDTVLAQGIARDLIQRQVRNIVFVGVRGYGTAFAGAIGDTLAAEDPEADYTTTLIEFDDDNDNQFVQAAADAAVNNPAAEEIVFTSSDTADCIRFMGLANTNEAYGNVNGDTTRPKRLFFGVAAANGAFVGNVPGVLEEGVPGSTVQWFGVPPAMGDYRVRSVRYSLPRPGAGSRYSGFLDRYRSQGFEGDPSVLSFTSHSYDASWLSIYTATWSLLQEGAVTGLGMAKGMRRISSGPDVDVGALGWTTVRAQFQGGRSVNVAGASSKLDYDPDTEENTSAGYDIIGYDLNAEGAAYTLKVLSTVPEP